ncbi:MAG TPA: hypothetical protein VFR47_27090 [Anaerolineales bacterium]|nr:hypothetical protein [Anaerolineales bacterium]
MFLQIYMNFSEFIQAFFDHEVEKRRPLFLVIWLLLLYITGIYFWGVFFNWGQTPLNYHDWRTVNLPRLDVIRDALVYGELPLHVTRVNFLHFITDRFFTMPDVITTPQQIVLYWIDIDTFAIFDLLIEFTIGAIGLYLFKQKYGISLFAFSIMYFLVCFNGYVQSHYSVGHVTWGGYFLFPLLVLFVTDFIDEQQNWLWVAKIAFLMFYMVLVGSQHHFVWSLIFLGSLGIVVWKKIGWIISAGFFAGMISAARLLPPVLVIPAIKLTGAFEFRTGFPYIQDIFSSLMFVRSIDYRFPSLPALWFDSTHYWEFNIYIGLAGTLIILWFGIIQWISDLRFKKRFSQLMLPTLVVFLLSIGQNYKLIILLNIPLFATERVTSRLIGLPLVVLIMISAFFLNEWLQGKPAFLRYVLAVFGLFWLVRDLFLHVKFWGVKAVSQALIKGYGRVLVQGNSISNHSDPPYMGILMIGMVLTLVFSLLLAVLVYREQYSRVKARVHSNG